MLTRGSIFEDMLLDFLGNTPMDVREDSKGFEIEVDLPGVDPGDIDIRVSGGKLSLKAERKWSKAEGKSSFRRSFSEIFVLPETVDSERISATYRQGVLKVSVPKRAGPPERKVEIQSA